MSWQSLIYTGAKVWVYRPVEHKNSYRGRPRVIFIGPRGQDVLRPFLRIDLQAFVISPAEAERERRGRIRTERKIPVWYGNRPGTNRKRAPRKTLCERRAT